MLDRFALDHLQAVRTIHYLPALDNGTIKGAVVSLAKAILLVEAFTFLLEYGHDYNEVP
jgi:hypothetical protein